MTSESHFVAVIGRERRLFYIFAFRIVLSPLAQESVNPCECMA